MRTKEAKEVRSTPAHILAPRSEHATPLKLQEGVFGEPDEHLVTLLAPESLEAEHYQAVRYAIEQHGQEGGIVVAVSSASPKDGKTLTALNLAGCLARDENKRVLIVDGDLRKPSVADYLQMKSPGPGLTGVMLRSGCTLLDSVQLHREFNLAVLPAGHGAKVPYELFSSPRMARLLEDARTHFDYTFVDLPPLLFPECRVIQKYVDGIVIVVAAHRTSRQHLAEALQNIDPVKILGAVFNKDSQRKQRISSYYDYQRG